MACSEDIGPLSVPMKPPAIAMLPPNPLQVELFMSLFRGRPDVYARRWEKDGRSGYSPAYEFSWDEFMVHKRRGGSLKDFENKRMLPLTPEVIKKHLLGLHIVGIYPILPDNTSYFLAADFDGEHWLKEAMAFIDASSRVQLNAYLERSRSGNGGHVWVFFSEAYPCYKSRQIGLELVRRALDISEFEKEISFDRLFPNQDTLSKAGFGNLIAMPLPGQYCSVTHCSLIRRQEPRSWINGCSLRKQGDTLRKRLTRFIKGLSFRRWVQPCQQLCLRKVLQSPLPIRLLLLVQSSCRNW